MTASDTANIMPFVTIAVAALTGLFTILGVVLANRASHRQLLVRLDRADERADKETLRARLEELYELVDEWAGSVVIHHVTYRRVMEGTLTYNQALDSEIDKESKTKFRRLFTLAELYFPDAHSELNEIKRLRDLASSIHFEFKELHRHSGATSQKHADGITEVLSHFNEAVDRYKNKLSEYARSV